MATNWLSVLRLVPWGDVIRNAPKVADGARKLWGTVAAPPPPIRTPDAGAPAAANASSGTAAVAALQARVATLEAATSDLHQQMLASSELIKALADQNTHLIERVEAHRRRLSWLAAGVAMTAIVAAVVMLFRLG